MIFDLNRTMFYKTSFCIEVEPGQDALWSLVLTIRRWLKGKANWNNYSMPWDTSTWSSVKAGASLSATGADVKLVSCLHIHDGLYTWACQLEETQDAGDGKAPRRWTTEIGFVGESLEKGRFSVVLSYADRPGFIGDLQDNPAPTVPHLIKLIVNDDAIRCTTPGIPVSLEAREITDPEAAFAIIGDEGREIPVVAVSPTLYGNTLVNPSELAKALGPNAVVLFANETQAMDELNKMLEPYDLQCYGGALRVYAPNPRIEQPGDSLRHRYISMKNGKEPQAVIAMLRRALAQDVHVWQSMPRLESVKRLNRLSSLAKRAEELKAHYEGEALEEMMACEEKVHAAELQLEEALLENEILRKENFDLDSRCKSYEAAFASARSSKGGMSEDLFDHMRSMNQLPSDPRDVAKLAVAVFPDRIDFTERGWKSLGACSTCAETLWQALFDIANVLQPVFAEKGADPTSEFNSNSSFEYCRGEGMQTRKDPKLMALRDDVYEGRAISIEPHVKSSAKNPSSPHFLRVYLAWDQPSGRVVIGSCGEHLDNYSTRSIR